MLVLLAISFLSLLAPKVQAVGNAMVMHHCPYPLWCARVRGYFKDDQTPAADRPAPVWMGGDPGQPFVYPFGILPPLTPMTIMCTRDPSVPKPLVTQLEFAWEPNPIVGGPPRVWWDVSNVEGHPFINEGFQYSVEASSADPFDKCISGGCPPGSINCQGAYDHPTDDVVSTSPII